MRIALIRFACLARSRGFREKPGNEGAMRKVKGVGSVWMPEAMVS
jgi:hypothetical protein